MNESIRRNPVRAGRLAMAVALLLAASAHGADFKFDIPAGDLKTALDAYVKQTGQQIVFKSDDVKGKTTPGVHGSLSDQQALDALLKGTGLQLRRDESGAVVVFPAEAVAGGASTKTAGGEDQKLEEIIVTATAISQLYTTSRAVTRIDADPMLLPMSVSAVQADLLQYQQATSAADVLANVSGMTVGGRVSASRGFNTSSAQNGVAFGGNAAGLVQVLPVVALDRVEVVKGPEQIIQGIAAGLGGTVNLVTKVPTPDDYALLGGAAGSEAYYRFDADVNGTLLDGEYGRLMGEVIGSTTGQDSGPKTTVNPSSDYVSAGLRWMNENTGSDLSVVYSYNDDKTSTDVVTVGGSHLHASDPQYVWGDPDSWGKQSRDLLEVHMQQRIVGSWNLDLTYMSRDETLGGYGFSEYGVAPQVVAADQSRTKNVTTGAEVYRVGISGQIDIGPVTNKLLLAYDHQSTDLKSGKTQTLGTYFTDLATGTKDFVPSDPPVDSDPYRVTSSQSGVLLTDQVGWDKWHALIGVRWLSADDAATYGRPVYYSYKQDTSQTLPQYGLVYAVNPQVSLYASSTEGFRAVGDLRTASGDLLPNTTFTQLEGGAKLLLLDSQLALTVALYQLKQKDVPAFVGYDPEEDRYVYKSVAGITSKGVEVELAGQPIRGLQLRTTFNYMDSADDKTGEPPYNGYLPSQFSIWSQYWFARNPGQGWWAGGGLSAWDAPKRQTDLGSWPGSTMVDLSAGYQNEHWQATAGVKNVGNVKALQPILGGDIWETDYFTAYRLPGREYRFDLSYRF